MASVCKKFPSQHKETMARKDTINGDDDIDGESEGTQYCDNCTCNNCKYYDRYCDDCYCKNCKKIRKSKGIKKEDKPHALSCCCTIIFALLTICVYANTSAQMTYDAECTLYDIKTVNCCYDKACNYGKRDVYKFMADCDECAQFYGINITNNTSRDGLSMARTVKNRNQFKYNKVKPNANFIFFDKSTECFPSQNALDDAKKDYKNTLFNVKMDVTVDCNVAKETKTREKLTDSEAIKCGTWWLKTEFDAANYWAPIFMTLTVILMVLTVILFGWDWVNKHYDISIVPKEKKDDNDEDDKIKRKKDD